jgi:hypothetical protein
MNTTTHEQSLLRWLSAFPPDSRERLLKVNMAATTAAHVILALTYGMYDPHIRKLNQVIIKLQVGRLRAERKGNVAEYDRIQCKLEELHVAIDAVTGVQMRAQPACNRVMRSR